MVNEKSVNINIRLPAKLKKEVKSILGENTSEIIRTQLQRAVEKSKGKEHFCFLCKEVHNPKEFYLVHNIFSEEGKVELFLICPDCFEEIINFPIVEHYEKEGKQDLREDVLVTLKIGACYNLSDLNKLDTEDPQFKEKRNNFFKNINYERLNHIRKGYEYMVAEDYIEFCKYFPDIYKDKKHSIVIVGELTEEEMSQHQKTAILENPKFKDKLKKLGV